MPAPMSEATLYLRDLWIGPVDDHIPEVSLRLGTWLPVPLDRAKALPLLAEVRSPPMQAVPIHPDRPLENRGLGSQPLGGRLLEGQPQESQPSLAVVENQLPPGIPISCLLGQKVVAMASHGIRDPCRKLQGIANLPADLRLSHIQLDQHQPGWEPPPKYTNM